MAKEEEEKQQVGEIAVGVVYQSRLSCWALVLTCVHIPVSSLLACWVCKLRQLDPVFVWHLEEVDVLSCL